MRKNNFADLRDSLQVLLKIINEAELSSNKKELKHLDVQFEIVKYNILQEFDDLNGVKFSEVFLE